MILPPHPKIFSAPSAQLISISLCVVQKVVMGGSAEGAKKFLAAGVNYFEFCVGKGVLWEGASEHPILQYQVVLDSYNTGVSNIE